MITHNITNQFTGYLGNRLFQAASTVGIAIKNDMEYGFLPNEYFSSFKNFPINKSLSQLHFTTKDEAGFGFENVNLSKGLHYNLMGYRQSYKYFEHCKDVIKDIFTFNDAILEKSKSIINSVRSSNPDKMLVSVHVRCGDYLTLKNHHTCLMDIGYYQKAVNEFDKDSTVFIIFSDDIDTANNHMSKIPGIKFTNVEKGFPALDLCTMSMLDGHIMANSSFSWWASWLSGKKTISPSKNKWFGPAYKDMNINDIIPPEWKQIE